MSRERPPSFQFYPRDFMADDAVQAMEWDQRGRYVWALCCSWMSDVPGVASEDQWRRWMGYTARQWAKARDAMVRPFLVLEDGSWRQKRMDEVRQRLRDYSSAVASAGGKARQSKLSPEERRALTSKASRARWERKQAMQADMQAGSHREMQAVQAEMQAEMQAGLHPSNASDASSMQALQSASASVFDLTAVPDTDSVHVRPPNEPGTDGSQARFGTAQPEHVAGIIDGVMLKLAPSGHGGQKS